MPCPPRCLALGKNAPVKDRTAHRTSSRLGRAALWLVLPASLLLGCSDDDVVAPASGACPPDNEVGGVCAGAPARVCEDDICSEGVDCIQLQSVSDQAGLNTALATIGTGCVALAPGSYGEASVPGGVHVLGAGASAVTIGQIGVTGTGKQSVIRGVHRGRRWHRRRCRRQSAPRLGRRHRQQHRRRVCQRRRGARSLQSDHRRRRTARPRPAAGCLDVGAGQHRLRLGGPRRLGRVRRRLRMRPDAAPFGVHLRLDSSATTAWPAWR